MSSIQRSSSQIPSNGAYVVTAAASGVFSGFTEFGSTQNLTTTVGAILYDMGKTARVKFGATDYVLRKVQLAVPGGTTTASNTIYINVGSRFSVSATDSLTASAVARL